MTNSVMWFRRDLRLADHQALAAAAAAAAATVDGGADDDGAVVALFVVDPRLFGPAGGNRRAFLVGCLRELDAAIEGRLVIRVGDPATVVPAVVGEVGANEVFVSGDFGPYGSARDDEVERSLEAGGVALRRVGSPYATEPGVILNKAGQPYKVFTPFSKAWLERGWPPPIDVPTDVRWVSIPGDPVPETPETAAMLPEPGEGAAHEALERFVRGPVAHYDGDRERPGVEGTSRLSAYLRWGCLHPRQVLDRLATGGRLEADSARVFRSELCWREFYADVLHHRPDTARHAFKPAMAAMELDRAGTAFERWCAGTTGYPMVDAGMRQLVAEGWMHNRVRMLTASFLVKDLHLDWTVGARWFMRHLVDGDLASNQHGWQWVAGTGTDASPFFRIFNPVTQGERFDPEGDYVRRWVPELAGMARRYLHRPWDDPAGLPPGYPSRVVDHAEEREDALRRYAAVRARAAR